MRRRIAGAALAGLLLSAVGLSKEVGKPLQGFSRERAAAQLRLESELDALIEAANLRRWLEQLAARPHPLGSAQGKANAEVMAELFRSWGYATRIDEFEVLFPTPRERRLELLSPEPYTAKLEEPLLGLPWSQSEQLPPYNAYSADGDVTGELVYVNYGLPQDYEELRRRGVSVAGRIVLVRYGQAWRGIKPELAAEHGSLGCILFSDPQLDGYFQGDVYPQGAYRPEHGVQRGSVLDLSAYPGDPLTPAAGATAGAARIPREQAASLARIPVLPISYGDALPLLRALAGPVAPEPWRGALPVTYHLRPGPARVRLRVVSDWRTVKAYDVIAVLAGAERPEEWIVRGDHHDGWVAGATDPVAGLVTLLEEARVIGELAKRGHPPRRTLVYAAWDGEEPGFLGSTEWAEANAEELRRKAAVYINSDSNARGFLAMGGSFTLQRLMNEVARDVPDPQSGVSVLERGLARLRVEGAAPTEPTISRVSGKRDEGATALPLDPLGSGSDFTAFLDYLGIAALDFSYCCDSDYGVYHSAYDSVEHFLRFVDPELEYGRTMVQTSGRVVLRLANADVLPFEFGVFAERLGAIAGELAQLADRMRDETERQNRWIAEGLYRILADTRRPLLPPEPKPPVPPLSFAPLEAAVVPEERRQALRGRHGPARRAAPAATGGSGRPSRSGADPDGTGAHPAGRAPRPALVPPFPLCPGPRHWLRREDPAGGPGSDRATAVRDRGSAGPGRRRGPGPLRR